MIELIEQSFANPAGCLLSSSPLASLLVREVPLSDAIDQLHPHPICASNFLSSHFFGRSVFIRIFFVDLYPTGCFTGPWPGSTEPTASIYPPERIRRVLRAYPGRAFSPHTSESTQAGKTCACGVESCAAHLSSCRFGWQYSGWPVTSDPIRV